MGPYVLDFSEVDHTKQMLVGGKGANLGELSKIPDISVPEGFCVTTFVFRKTLEQNELLNTLFGQLKLLSVEDRDQIRDISRKIRQQIMITKIPSNAQQAIFLSLKRYGDDHAYAIRSSATAEDLPHASFAGQQDSYLNIKGKTSILEHIRKCWASLFTDRAVTYRMQNGFSHDRVYLSVIIQRMIFPEVSGVVFTGDPLTSNRTVLSIDASFGLGEAIVSGIISADNYKVQKGKIIESNIASKNRVMHVLEEGGTEIKEQDLLVKNQSSLSEDQIIQLEKISRKIEAYFKCPQDIEWCLIDNIFHIVQSRPITTLFPIPIETDQEKHVYVSVGHQQMMTDSMKPLGLSFYLLTTSAPMKTAGGRLFVDITNHLNIPSSRKNIIDSLGKSDPLIKDALMTIVEREGFLEFFQKEETMQAFEKKEEKSSSKPMPDEIDPTTISTLIEKNVTSIKELQKNLHLKSGSELINFIIEDIHILKKHLFDPQGLKVIMATMEASAWINENIYNWLGEKNVADILSQSVPNNITSEMGLALLDVADVIRPYPEIIEYLKEVREDNYLTEIVNFHGGVNVQRVILRFLENYGMRCAGEIDITRNRWSEKPSTILPMILGNIRNFETNASKKKFEKGQQFAWKKEQEIMNKLKELPDGERKVLETKRRIDLIRNFSGYREYPKYTMITRYFLYKQALLREAHSLVERKVLMEKEDIYYLNLEELQKVINTKQVDKQMIQQRKKDFLFYEKLTPPRVLTSDGEILMGKYKHENLPANSFAALPVSTGVVEGRARVILSMENAKLEKGDILVTKFTDPSWTPLFVAVVGLVTEVGGLMTHGAVIAREYGLPAVVGLENATNIIKDGQRIRLNGTDGYIELL